MFCPNCGIEYRAGFTVCSDCQVSLVPDPPGEPSEGLGEGSEESRAASGDAAVVLAWSGTNPRQHAEACELLEQANIPANTVRPEEHLIHASSSQALEVYVPAEFAAKAEIVLHELRSAQKEWQQLAESGALELPAEDDVVEDESNGRRNGLAGDADELTAEIWAGRDADTALMIKASLRENHISCRSASGHADSPDLPEQSAMLKLFVPPEDETRAKEIVREILDAAPL